MAKGFNFCPTHFTKKKIFLMNPSPSFSPITTPLQRAKRRSVKTFACFVKHLPCIHRFPVIAINPLYTSANFQAAWSFSRSFYCQRFNFNELRRSNHSFGSENSVFFYWFIFARYMFTFWPSGAVKVAKSFTLQRQTKPDKTVFRVVLFPKFTI